MRLGANPDDLSTPARIRDAAVRVFAAQGFGVGVRAIAAAAGVSPGLVNHHFGSKDGLHAACDDWVLETIRTHKSAIMRDLSPQRILDELDDLPEWTPILGYMLRSFTAGGRFARAMFEHMVADAEKYIAEGVAAGALKPSRDPAARARYLALSGLGAVLLHLQLSEHPEDLRTALLDLPDVVSLPSAELYTYGFFTDTTLFDTLTEGGHR